MPAESENLTASHFPFVGDDDATRRAINVAVASVEDMIHLAVKRAFPRINRADHDDFVQHIRIRLARYTAKRFDSSRAKWSTLAHTAITNLCRARLRVKKKQRRHEDIFNVDVQAKCQLHDVRVERLAQAILSDPRRFVLARFRPMCWLQ